MYKHFIIIGAPKCGTSSMHKILDEHPHVSMARGKEINYFIVDEISQKPYEDYLTYFDKNDATRFLGEASPRYANGVTSDSCYDLMSQTLNNVYLFYMVRDPLERIASLYFHRLRSGADVDSFENEVESGKDYLEGSNYPKHIKMLTHKYGHIPKVIEFNDFINDPRKVAKCLLKTLEADLRLLPNYGKDHFNIGDKVGINAKSNPLRHKLLLASKYAASSFKQNIPKHLKDSFKSILLGSNAFNREDQNFKMAKKELFKKHHDFFMSVKNEMQEQYGVNTAQWFKNIT